MEHKKRLYETTFIVNASLEDTQIESTVNHVQEIVTRNGGELQSINRWGRKRLAYPIEKKNNGFYVNLEFVGTGIAVSQLERAFLLDENILRFLTIQVDKRAQQARTQSPQPSVVAGESPAPTEEGSNAESSEKKPLFDDDISSSAPSPESGV